MSKKLTIADVNISSKSHENICHQAVFYYKGLDAASFSGNLFENFKKLFYKRLLDACFWNKHMHVAH